MKTVNLEFDTQQEYLPKKIQNKDTFDIQKLKIIIRRLMNTRNKRNSSSGNLHLLKGMKNTRKHNYTGKYKGFFSYYLNIFKR